LLAEANEDITRLRDERDRFKGLYESQVAETATVRDDLDASKDEIEGLLLDHERIAQENEQTLEARNDLETDLRDVRAQLANLNRNSSQTQQALRLSLDQMNLQSNMLADDNRRLRESPFPGKRGSGCLEAQRGRYGGSRQANGGRLL